jgi:hypothetical protein
LQLFANCFKNRAAINAVSRLDTNNDIPTNTGNLQKIVFGFGVDHGLVADTECEFLTIKKMRS